jgi:hypothetical protein
MERAMTEAELRAAEAGRRLGIQDVELMIMRQYEPALKANDTARLSDLKIALRIVREQFPELVRDAGQPPQHP